MVNKTYQEVLSWASSFLEAREKEGYAILYVFLARKNWTKTDWLLHMKDIMPQNEYEQLQSDLTQLLDDYPPQYLLGYEEFFGRRFKVNTATLIPRPETEELVDWCLQATVNQKNEKLHVVDVGTGTGAIAATLKLERPAWQVDAVDISEEALEIAQMNSHLLEANVRFYLGNTLEPIDQPIDILIANPPYISQDEWSLMDLSVRQYEPQIALFAENNGLAIYQKIAQQAQEKLVKQGMIFLEIGFNQGEAVEKIFQKSFPQKKVQRKKDLSGNDRMLAVY
ncbi:peptide chain release factor N(5)-glutamine methyltransferase [Tetragenococcus koreensis]|uniref:Release factor glutamine methyltransferase n=1 Tax=Tetragenococcus koreensis TaxID=290335 RepID=A0AAN4RJ12_9ENTE|nr:peptide chain release factor N(5)-glutamine methyltransferase [Tetragenococcus koreensis]MCF1584933.1 peptide chain release factor N(5)-glutamine methyltransferase [Tetragenococcus koreensis]MCF1614446.1 peptide chain release factor N(5)-glutamine methyltransferase [Tetragenococcus koreensis]MCF1617244.1 peptide chain release factor N(5)-glutamine methyltransferase [Tetragenococcus koreensis]MCF1619849.1 peptide chain release factor N(5)-glutamine methyltransferase [Tetragenococcus koreensis